MSLNGQVEKVFFGDSRAHLRQLSDGVPTEELMHKPEIILSEPLHAYVKQKVDVTAGDSKFRERWALLRFVPKGEIAVVEEGLTKPFDFEKGEGGTVESSSWPFFRNLFAKPIDVFFHTHPIFSEFSLDNLKTSRGQIFKVREQDGSMSTLTRDQIYSAFRDSQWFSTDDLKNLEMHARYLRSLMLATDQGIRWILNPVFRLPLSNSGSLFPGNPFVRPVKAYDFSMALISDQKVRTLRSGKSLNVDELQPKYDSALQVFCTDTGLVAFGNNDINNPRLINIDNLVNR